MSDELKWAYLAGFTDGDGCITREMSKGQYRYSRVTWAQKESASEVLDWIAEFLEAQGIKVSNRKIWVALKGHKYPQRTLGVTSAGNARLVIRAMLPYLVVKRAAAEEALEILDRVHDLKQVHGNKYNFRRAEGCSVPDCDRRYYAKAKCKHHYDQGRRGRVLTA